MCKKRPGTGANVGMVTINEDLEMTAQMGFFYDKINKLFPGKIN